MNDSLLDHISHRPYPAPGQPWVMEQTWQDLLFMHWPVRPESLRPLIPPALELDTIDGQAWLGIVPFAMVNVHLRGLPNLPFTANFLELNVRTYVKCRDKAGVFFFSLDASSPICVEVARLWYQLPYFHSQMWQNKSGQHFSYTSYRADMRGGQARLDIQYHPTGDVFRAEKETLEYWLTERYCLFTSGRNNQLCLGEIHHKPWPLQIAEATIKENSMCNYLGIELPSQKPLLHYVKKLETLEWQITMANIST